MYARGNFPALRSAARHGISAQDSACLSSRLHCRQPRRGPAARRRRHPQAGQRQCRRHQRAAHPGRRHSRSGSSSSTSPRAGSPPPCCPGFALPGDCAGASDPGGVAAGGCAPSPPSSATYFRCGTAFAAARAWPRSSARSPASSSRCCCRCLRAGSAVVDGLGFRRPGLDHRGVRHPRLSTDA